MRRNVSARSGGIRFLAMRAKRACSLSWRANFAESLMPIVRNSPMPVGERLARRLDCILARVDASFTIIGADAAQAAHITAGRPGTNRARAERALRHEIPLATGRSRRRRRSHRRTGPRSARDHRSPAQSHHRLPSSALHADPLMCVQCLSVSSWRLPGEATTNSFRFNLDCPPSGVRS